MCWLCCRGVASCCPGPFLAQAKTTMAPGLLESRKRKEVILTREEAIKKKLPKGYALEPILPAAPGLTPEVPVLEDKDSRKKKVDAGRRAVGQVGAGALGLDSAKDGCHVAGSNGVADGQHGLGLTLATKALLAKSGALAEAERAELRKAFGSELGFLQRLVKEIETREADLAEQPLSGGSGSGGNSRKRLRRPDDFAPTLDVSPPAPDAMMLDGGFGEVGQSGTPLPRLKHSNSVQLSAGDSMGAQTPKRTPKANSTYINQDFISGQDKMPPPEKSSKGKTAALKKSGSGSQVNGGKMLDLNDPKRQRVEAARAKRMGDILRQCQTVLKKVMTQKHSWIFNVPVDVKGLGLHDYLTIIKKPMDLGTIKQRLSASLYQHPDEFQADVHLVWSNAMTYNPPGHDVYVMAMGLKKLFDEAYCKIQLKLQEDAAKRAQEEKELREWTPAREKTEVLELERRLQVCCRPF